MTVPAVAPCVVRRFTRLGVAFGVAVLGGCATLGTREPLVSDRPDFTESTSLIAPGHVQVEVGATLSSVGPVRELAAGELFTRIGLVNGLELRVVGNSLLRQRVAGTSSDWAREDALLGVKFPLLAGNDSVRWRPALSVIAGSTIPTGSVGLRAPHAQPEVKLLASWTLTERIGFASNLNYNRPVDGARSIDEYSGSASFSFALTERLGAYTEGFAFAPQDGSGDVQKFVNAGVTFLFSPDLQLDARAGIGPARRTGDHFLGIGIVRRW